MGVAQDMAEKAVARNSTAEAAFEWIEKYGTTDPIHEETKAASSSVKHNLPSHIFVTLQKTSDKMLITDRTLISLEEVKTFAGLIQLVRDNVGYCIHTTHREQSYFWETYSRHDCMCGSLTLKARRNGAT